MAAVVTFWWFPDEEESFLSFLESTGKVMALPFLAVNTRDELIPRPMRECVPELDRLFIGLEDFTTKAVVVPIDGPATDASAECFRVSDMESCVVGYDRGRLDATGALTASNLYGYLACPNRAADAMIDKPAEFVTWLKKVMAWVRKATPERHQHRNYRVSKRVKEAIVKDGLEITS